MREPLWRVSDVVFPISGERGRVVAGLFLLSRRSSAKRQPGADQHQAGRTGDRTVDHLQTPWRFRATGDVGVHVVIEVMNLLRLFTDGESHDQPQRRTRPHALLTKLYRRVPARLVETNPRGVLKTPCAPVRRVRVHHSYG